MVYHILCVSLLWIKIHFMRAILILLLVCMSHISFSQQSPYSQQWVQVDILELKGQAATALKIVNEIRSASKSRAGSDYIKASIFRWKFLKITTEDAENIIIQELNTALQAANKLDKAVLNTFKAGLLNDYFRENEYRFNERSSGEEKSNDLTTWTPSELVKEINTAYKRALEDTEQLLATPAAQVQDLLRSSIATRAYKPTLYDVIAQEAMSFYKSAKYGTARPEVLFEIDNPFIFKSSKAFRAWNFSTEDSIFSLFNAVKLLQEIEEHHKNDTDKTAFIYAQLERLEFAKTQFKGGDKMALYGEGLMELSRKHKNNLTNHILQYALASYYVDLAPKSYYKGIDPLKLLYYKKAEGICQDIIKTAPNTEASVKATQLLKEIQQMSLSLRTKSHNFPGVENRIWVEYRNVDSLTIRVVKLDSKIALEDNYNLPSQVREIISSNNTEKIVATQVCALPQAQDANFHTVEYLIPALEAGYYIIYADNGALEEIKSYAFAKIEVSDFGYKKTDYEKKVVYRFYDRSTGQALVNLPVSSQGNKARYATQGETNTLGEYEITKASYDRRNRNNQVRVTAVRAGDTLVFSDNIYPYYNNDRDRRNRKAKSLVFLDRGIYRPGQPMYFKGIVMQEVDKISKIVAGERVKVVIRDPNYQEIFTKEFVTNAYGSFSGEFDLPEEVLTGQFTIRIEQPEGRSNFWSQKTSFSGGYATFRVEAYKRPTFEVTFNPVTQAYTPGDSITIRGNARAFLGSNVTGASGEYTIKRAKYNKYWDYYRNYNNTDQGRQMDAGMLTTDDEGNFEITFKADFEGEPQDVIMQFTAAIKITDLNGETQVGSLDIKVSKNNLYTTLTEIKKLTGGDKITLEITNINLSDVPVACDNTLRIFKMQTPDKVFFDRFWEAPEHQEIGETAFAKAFPHEPYNIASIPRARGKMVYEGSFPKQSEYEVTIPTDQKWEAGEYEIEHIAQGENNTEAITLQSFTLIQPKNTYLPADQLFTYEQLTKNPREEGQVQLGLKTSLKNLAVFVDGFYNGERFFAEKVDVNGQETVTITLDASYEQEAVIRLKYAHYDRFFYEDIAIDLSAPQEFLQIETETFRSTLYPDSKEQWSFKITDQNNKKAQAEVLASMYDLSLDNFAPSYWSKDLKFREAALARAPQLDSYEKYVATFRVRIKQQPARRYVSSFDRFNYFGLSLRSGSYVYNNYLSRLKLQRSLSNKVNHNAGSARGVVLEESGAALPGASVVVKGTSIGTQTDFDGQFSIAAKVGDTLVISYVGFETQEVVVDKYILYATLLSDQTLDEVVVFAQGLKRERKALGYAVSAEAVSEKGIGEDEIKSLYSYDNAYLDADSESRSETKVNIRGFNSILQNNELLKVVDGEILGKGDALPDPDTILSVEVLRGLKAATLYGKEGRNGVLLITTKSPEDFDKVDIRKNLQETAFFFPHLTTNKKGEIKFNFDAPQLLTRWKFRVLAHSKGLSTALEEKEVVTQKDLSIVPNTPRFLREGDTVLLSAKVANLTSKQLEGAAQLQLFDASTMQPIDAALANTTPTQNIAIDPNGNTSVFWEIKIPVGMQAVTYRMVAKAGKFSDGEENILPVLPNRMLVTATVPFLVRAGEQKDVQMSQLLENTSESLTHQQFAFEYTANPSWYALQSLPYLMEFPHDCAEQTFSRLYANSLSAKILNSNPKIKAVFNQWKGDGVLKSALEKNEDLKNILIAETPWLRAAQSETERKKRLGLLFDLEKNAFAKAKALKKLQKIQNGDGGFPWFSGGNSSAYITRHIVAGLGHLERLGISIEASTMLVDVIDFLDRALEKDWAVFIKRGGKEEDFYKKRSHLHYLYARSFFEKEHPLPAKAKQIAQKTLAHYNEVWLEKSVYEKGLLAVVNHRLGKPAIARTILTGLKESAVQSKVNGMYWKENRSGWYWYQAPIETHALLIEAFDEIMEDQKTVEELKIWLLQQKRTGDWDTTKATAAATYALLMSGTQFIELDDSVRFTMQSAPSQQKLDAAPREAGTGYLKATWSAKEVSKEVAQLRIQNTGTTVGYGGLYWQYFENLDKIEKGEEQILNLSKKLFVVNDQDTTAALEEITSDTPLSLGQTVRVQLTIKTGSAMEFVHLKDMRASGLEPIDVLSKHQYRDGVSYYQSTRDVATHFFFEVLPLGTYVIEYDMRVNTKGSFSNGISTIQSMYAPEFSGNTAGMRIKVE